MKKQIPFILGACFFSLLIIIILYWIADDFGDNPHPFTRVFANRPLVEFSGELRLEYNTFYIVGSDTDHIYLGNFKDPYYLLFTNVALTDTQVVRIQSAEKFKLSASQFTIDSKNLYLSDLSAHTLFHGSIKDFHIQPLIKDRVFLAEAVPISPSSFVIRTWKDDAQELVLAKRSNYPPYLQKAPDLLEKQIDGVICTDGMLNYNKELDQLIYVYYYRNQFICVDTTLSLLYRGHTLDTVTYAGMKMGKLESDHVVATTLGRSSITNRISCTSGPWLYINSKLRASNEEKHQFRKASVIDVYDLTNKGAYTVSFYLPKYKGHRVKSFKVFQNRVVAIYDRYLVIYLLATDYFSKGRFI